MPDALAYFITWTTYATRLHGDERGTTDRERTHHGPRTIDANSIRKARALARLRDEHVLLGERSRDVVEQAIRDHANHRAWTILALSVRSNHVHVVADCRTPSGAPAPEKVMQEFKSWGTRRLRASGAFDADRPIWTQHGSTRWINNKRDLDSAIDYVRRLQDVPRR